MLALSLAGPRNFPWRTCTCRWPIVEVSYIRMQGDTTVVCLSLPNALPDVLPSVASVAQSGLASQNTYCTLGATGCYGL